MDHLENAHHDHAIVGDATARLLEVCEQMHRDTRAAAERGAHLSDLLDTVAASTKQRLDQEMARLFGNRLQSTTLVNGLLFVDLEANGAPVSVVLDATMWAPAELEALDDDQSLVVSALRQQDVRTVVDGYLEVLEARRATEAAAADLARTAGALDDWLLDMAEASAGARGQHQRRQLIASLREEWEGSAAELLGAVGLLGSRAAQGGAEG